MQTARQIFPEASGVTFSFFSLENQWSRVGKNQLLMLLSAATWLVSLSFLDEGSSNLRMRLARTVGKRKYRLTIPDHINGNLPLTLLWRQASERSHFKYSKLDLDHFQVRNGPVAKMLYFTCEGLINNVVQQWNAGLPWLAQASTTNGSFW